MKPRHAAALALVRWKNTARTLDRREKRNLAIAIIAVSVLACAYVFFTVFFFSGFSASNIFYP